MTTVDPSGADPIGAGPVAAGRPARKASAALPRSFKERPPGPGARFSEWLDAQAKTLFIMPAVTLILIFSVFPLVASIVIAFGRVRLRGGGYTYRFVGLRNFEKQLFGSEQYHFLGVFTEISVFGWMMIIGAAVFLIWWLIRYVRRKFWWLGFIGRLITASLAFGLVALFAATTASGNQFGTLGVTLLYVGIGCLVQFSIGLGLALLCSQPIRGKTFFRVTFFVPLMITPIGIGYAFRMLADTQKGPFAPAWQWVGLGDFSWATDPWAARSIIVLADSWQWIPFIFVVLLAALENTPKDYVEAAEVDGAGGWQIFREITWPQIMPVAATVMLIRVIEGFKLVDLPNIMTSGGPGIATESMTLHALFAWRSLDLGQSAAISYLLLFVTVVICVSFFNMVVLARARNT
ncbi:MAG: sugar ABC transporter permease [Alphaproteobacteria bacterium]|nr:sugar ABC transporter permease [Alphaproteobacteria bacterium]